MRLQFAFCIMMVTREETVQVEHLSLDYTLNEGDVLLGPMDLLLAD